MMAIITKFKQASLMWLLILVCACSTLDAKPLPNLGDYANIVLPKAKEQLMGHVFMQQLRAHLPIIHDAVTQQYLQQQAQQLIKHSRAPKTKLHLFIVNDTSINAFAGPGGYIGVNAGLLLQSANQTEMTAVLAHEISHVVLRHIAHEMANSRTQMLPMLIGLAASIAAGVAGSGQAAMAGMTATLAESANRSLKFSQLEEQQADINGIKLLARSGYNPYGMVWMLKTFRRKYMLYNHGLLLSYSDHPPVDQRIANAEYYARHAAYTLKAHNHLDFNLMQARMIIFTSTDLRQTRQQFKTQAFTFKHHAASANNYGIALSDYLLHNSTAALTVIKHNPNHNNAYVMLLKLRVLISLQRYARAQAILNQLQHQHFNAMLLLGANIKLAMRQHRYRQASAQLQQAIIFHPQQIDLYLWLAKLDAKQQHTISARLNYAKALQLNGDVVHALLVYHGLLKLKLNDDQKELVKASIVILKHQLIVEKAQLAS